MENKQKASIHAAPRHLPVYFCIPFDQVYRQDTAAAHPDREKDRVQSLQHEISDLQQSRDAAQKALTEMIEGLKLEAIL
jgi:hypothetical protein